MVIPTHSRVRLQDRIGRLSKSELKKMGIRHLRVEEHWLGTWSYAERKSYARQYVAIKGKQVVAASRSLATVNRILDEERLRLVLIAHIADPDAGIIYAL